MFYVYCGYASPDNCDASEGPTYLLHKFAAKEELLKFKQDFDALLNDDCVNVIFRVISGDELALIPKERVVDWHLESL